MACCDICNADGEGTLVGADEVRKAVSHGFNPFSLGLVPQFMSDLFPGAGDRGSAFQRWKNTVVAVDTTDWNLCEVCYEAILPYLPGRAGPAPAGGAGAFTDVRGEPPHASAGRRGDGSILGDLIAMGFYGPDAGSETVGYFDPKAAPFQMFPGGRVRVLGDGTGAEVAARLGLSSTQELVRALEEVGERERDEESSEVMSFLDKTTVMPFFIRYSTDEKTTLVVEVALELGFNALANLLLNDPEFAGVDSPAAFRTRARTFCRRRREEAERMGRWVDSVLERKPGRAYRPDGGVPAPSEPEEETVVRPRPRPTPGPNLFARALAVLVLAAAAAGAYLWWSSDAPAARLASSLRRALAEGRLLGSSGDDAYALYKQLRALDPGNGALAEVAPAALPKLKGEGDELFLRKMTVGTADVSRQEWERAQTIYEWARLLDPNDNGLEARAHFVAGQLAADEKRWGDAEKSFDAAARSDQAWGLPQNSLGILRERRERLAEAAAFYERATGLRPEWEIPHSNLGRVYYRLKRYDKAIESCRAAISINRGWARPHYYIGLAYEAKGMRDEAIEAYEAALSLNPQNLDLGGSAASIGKRIEALRAEQEAEEQLGQEADEETEETPQ